jgi:uncharacterized membrane protein
MDDQQPTKTDRSFRLNPPTVICLLYLATCFTVISAVVGVVFAYAWRRDQAEAWEASHYTYLIRAFWMAVLSLGLALDVLFAFAFERDNGGPDGSAVLALGAATALCLAPAVLLVVRCSLSLVNAQRNRPMPMPKPRAWLA